MIPCFPLEMGTQSHLPSFTPTSLDSLRRFHACYPASSERCRLCVCRRDALWLYNKSKSFCDFNAAAGVIGERKRRNRVKSSWRRELSLKTLPSDPRSSHFFPSCAASRPASQVIVVTPASLSFQPNDLQQESAFRCTRQPREWNECASHVGAVARDDRRSGKGRTDVTPRDPRSKGSKLRA